MALVTNLEAMRAAYRTGDHAQKCRNWKLFRLSSRMILWRQEQRGPTKAELARRVDIFHRQEWLLLLDEARHSSSGLRRKTTRLTIEEEEVRCMETFLCHTWRRGWERSSTSLRQAKKARWKPVPSTFGMVITDLANYVALCCWNSGPLLNPPNLANATRNQRKGAEVSDTLQHNNVVRRRKTAQQLGAPTT